MTTTVADRCRAIATFRHVSIRIMEALARWTPLTPEMEAKVMFGRHIWDYAQMANWLGERTFELRQAKHFTLQPVAAYEALLREASAAGSTAERVSAVYDGVVPGLVARYERYVAATDAILDEPSIVIVRRIVRELERQRGEAAELRRELALDSGAGSDLVMRERAIAEIVAEAPRA